MAESRTDANESPTVVGRPGTAAGRRSRTDGDRVADRITITRWNLGLSLALALSVLTGAFTLVWDEVATLDETQVTLVSGVSRLEVKVETLSEDVTMLREEMRAEVAMLREEMRADFRALGDLIRARETSAGDAQ